MTAEKVLPRLQLDTGSRTLETCRMSQMIPKRVIDDIRVRTDIAELIGSYINLKRAGSTLKALCPFHKEKTPSFTVNSQRQIFHCFGCGVGGDAFSFMMKYEGVDFVGAIRLLAKRAGVPIELEEGDRAAADKATLYRIHEELAQFYRRCLLQLPGAAGARNYLAERDLSDEIAKEFLVGYAPDRWDAAIKWAAKHKFKLEQLEKCGLIIRSEKTPGKIRFYDRFRNRLMFPIRDEQDRIIGFSGRALSDDAKAAKYINSPETPLFHKGKILYALEKARRNIVESREAILCEGQIDVIRCHSAGLTTAVASQGTAFTDLHARILQRYADSVALVFDPDKAGQDAAVKAAGTFLEAGLAVRVAMLPQGEDPDSFIRNKGVEEFRTVLDKAASVTSFQIDVMSGRENLKTEVGLMRTAHAVLQTISHSPNAVQRARLVQEAAHMLGLPANALQDDLRHMMTRNRPYQRDSSSGETPGTRAESPETGKESAQNIPMEERALCEHLVHCDPDTIETVRRFLPPDMLRSEFCRRMAHIYLEAAESGRDVQDIIRDGEDPSGSFSEFAAAVQMAPRKAGGTEFSHLDAARDLVLRMWRREMESRRAALKPDSKEERARMTYELDALKNWDTGSAVIEIEMKGR